MTTRQVEEVIDLIYGSYYSKNSISRITTDFSTLVDAWLYRSWDSYSIVYIDAIHIKIRRDRVASETFYVPLGLKEDLSKEAFYPIKGTECRSSRIVCIR